MRSKILGEALHIYGRYFESNTAAIASGAVGCDTRFASSQWYLRSSPPDVHVVARRFAGKSSNSNITKPFIRKLESSRPVVSLNLCERCYRRGR